MLHIASRCARIAREAINSTRMLTRSQVTGTSAENISITHNIQGKAFVATLGDEKGFLQYSRDNSTINVLHVFVPEVFRGKGIAQILSQAALDYISQNNLKMIMTCPYFKYYVETIAPQYKKYLV